MEPYQDEPLLSVVGAIAEGVDWTSESSESAGENEIEIVACTSTVLADIGERFIFWAHFFLRSASLGNPWNDNADPETTLSEHPAAAHSLGILS
ncbi:hypothetical protein ACOMHN_043655 [Nucella lapillus]